MNGPIQPMDPWAPGVFAGECPIVEAIELDPFDPPAITATPLCPNRADIAAHLYALFPPAFVQAYPDAWVEIAYANPATGGLDAAENFSAFDLQAAAEFAEKKNRAGFNIYVGAALRHGERCGRANGENVLTASHSWAEFDQSGDDARIHAILQEKNLLTTLTVVTGRTPNLRAHLYFRLDGSVTPDQLRATNTALKTLLGSDAVQNPDRVMRLAGTINYPPQKKVERGYIAELVTLQIRKGAPAYTVEQLAGAPTKTRLLDCFDYKRGRDDDKLITLLEASRTPGNWHTSIRDAIATMIGREWTDSAIKLSCAPYCRDGASDPDLAPLIKGAREKWNRPNEEREEQPGPRKLSIIDPTAWQGRPVPPREWIVQDMIPAYTVSLLMGDGAAGKTTLALQLAVARALGRDWIGSIPSAGRTLFLSAEDDEDELHRRIDAIREHYGAAFSDLGELRAIDLVGEDAVLGELQRNGGIIKATPLLRAVAEQVESFQPDLVIIDALADAFAGDENNRTQARQFIGLLKRLARQHRAAFLCLAHPSLYGMNSGSGSSGSTGWSNSVRSRLYFEAVKSEDGDEQDPGLRQLSLKKSNYGPLGHPTIVRWSAGAYVPKSGGSSLDRLAASQKAQETFITLLSLFNEQGQTLSPSKGANYAPTLFARHKGGKGISPRQFADAMQELLDRKAIKVEVSGPPSRQRKGLVTHA